MVNNSTMAKMATNREEEATTIAVATTVRSTKEVKTPTSPTMVPRVLPIWLTPTTKITIIWWIIIWTTPTTIIIIRLEISITITPTINTTPTISKTRPISIIIEETSKLTATVTMLLSILSNSINPSSSNRRPTLI